MDPSSWKPTVHDTDFLIQTEGLRRTYSTQALDTHALAGVDIAVKRGDYLTIEGPSGCGKSTLLSVLGLLDEPTSGSYRLDGVPTDRIDAEAKARLRNGKIGFVFQSFNLIGEMSVAENVGLPLVYRKGVGKAEMEARVSDALEKVGMTARAAHRPSQLSGGQQQRVAIARALIGAPALILADEPTGNLDQDNGDQIMALLDALHQQGTTLITVTHNPDYARRAARRLRMRDGRIVDEVAS
jgi:putative ABC transport system ATP-binding protein